jgi:hypothetical protein
MLALLLPLCAALAEPKARGILSTNTANVGEAVEYELIVEGGEAPDNPPAPNVDGLELRGTTQSSQLSIINSNVTRRVTYTYTLMPKREGQFTIPPLEVRVGTRVLKTLPATLTVTRGEAMNEAGDLAFAKISLPKNSLYIGEISPMEVRLYLDAGAVWDLRAMPTLSGDGFTTRKFGKPTERNIQLAGKTYHLVTFSTVVTPGKAGKISIGPVPVNLVVSKPTRNQQRFDIFGRNLGPAQEMAIEAPAFEMDVKPLPVEGRPKDFSGAIGKFEFEATGTPQRVKVGEPVSMKLTIKGSGNFERIGQPPLAEPDGWTTYSAKEDFQGGDTAGTEGVKTFELPVTPTTGKRTMPVFAFSYFDPEAAKYVTLKNAAAPLTVEGAPVITAPAPAPATAKTPEPPKPDPKAPAVQDILANLPDIGAASGAFGPPSSPVVFFSMMFAPVPLAFVVLAWRRRRTDGKLARIAALRRERAGLIAKVKGAASHAEVLDAAVKAMRIHAQLENGGTPPDDDAAALLGSRKLDAETEKSLREIFEARTELLYAGAAPDSDRISDSERDRVMDAMASFEKSPRR